MEAKKECEEVQVKSWNEKGEREKIEKWKEKKNKEIKGNLSEIIMNSFIRTSAMLIRPFRSTISFVKKL